MITFYVLSVTAHVFAYVSSVYEYFTNLFCLLKYRIGCNSTSFIHWESEFLILV